MDLGLNIGLQVILGFSKVCVYGLGIDIWFGV